MKKPIRETAGWFLLICILLQPFSVPASESTVSTHAVAIDPSQPFPAVMYSDILKSMSDQVFWENGQLRFFERVRMTFLPAFEDPQHIAPYNASTGAFLVSQLKNESGDVISTVFWEARQDRFPYWNTSAVGNSDPAPMGAGAYTLTWMVDGKPFWSLEFEVSEAPAASAYDQPVRFLEGPWDDWAYIYVPNGNLSQTPTFNVFLRDKAAKLGQWIDKDVRLEVLRDGAVVAQYGANGFSRQSAKPWWVAFEFALRNPADDGFTPASDILAEGEYTVIVRIDGEEYGRYVYQAHGEIPFAGRQDRDSADPMTYLEGAQDRFYLKRQ